MTTIYVDFEQMEPGVLEGGGEIEQADPAVPLKLRPFDSEAGSSKQIIQIEMGESPASGIPATTPETIVIGSLLDDRLRMTADVTVNLEREAGHFIANFEGIQEFGYGLSPLEAVDDLRKTISELYWSLNEEDALGSDLEDVRNILNDLIERL